METKFIGMFEVTELINGHYIVTLKNKTRFEFCAEIKFNFIKNNYISDYNFNKYLLIIYIENENSFIGAFEHLPLTKIDEMIDMNNILTECLPHIKKLIK